MKVVLISDIHTGQATPSTTNKGIVRQANGQALDQLDNFISYCQKLEPDLVVHLGDAIRDTKNPSIDQENLLATLKKLQQINIPTIHLLGNHDRRTLTAEEIKIAYQSVGAEPKFYGYQESTDFNLIWLDFELANNFEASMSTSQINWLKQLEVSDKPTIVFSHYSLTEINPQGSFYFKNNPLEMCYHDMAEVRDILKSKRVRLCINAHVHFFSHQIYEKIHYISNPAFSENIAATKFPVNHPCVYSLLEIDPKNFSFTSYSEEFAFAKAQGELN